MACRSCGGGGGQNVVPRQNNPQSPSAAGDMVLMEYIGIAEQKQRIRSKVVPREQYVFSGNQRKFRAYRGDVGWLVSMAKQFRVAQQEAAPAAQLVLGNEPVLVSEARPVPDLPVDVLSLDPVVVALLKRKFRTVNELKRAGQAEWMTIKGMGQRRADLVQEAIDAL